VIARDDTPVSGNLSRYMFYAQNWRGDVVGMLNGDGTAFEHVRYTSYGRPIAITAANVYGSGTSSVQDIFNFQTLWFASDPYADFNLDGVIATQDVFDQLNAWFAYSSGGIDKLDSGSHNRKGYAGYEHDPIVQHLEIARHRYYRADAAAWIRVDPIGYESNTPNLYEYVFNSPLGSYDPTGLQEILIDPQLEIPIELIEPKIFIPRVLRPTPSVNTPPTVPIGHVPEVPPEPEEWKHEYLPKKDPDLKGPHTPTKRFTDIEPKRKPSDIDPCAHIYRTYKELEKQLAGKTCAAAADCTEALAIYDQIKLLHSRRILMKRCLFDQGRSIDPGHDKQIEDVYNRMTNCYKHVRDKCNDEIWEKNRFLERHPEFRKPLAGFIPAGTGAQGSGGDCSSCGSNNGGNFVSRTNY
jgi:RHS repeat-associated protein